MWCGTWRGDARESDRCRCTVNINATRHFLQGRNPHPSRKFVGKLLLTRSAIFITGSRPWCVTSTECVWTSLPTLDHSCGTVQFTRGVFRVGATILLQQVDLRAMGTFPMDGARRAERAPTSPCSRLIRRKSETAGERAHEVEEH